MRLSFALALYLSFLECTVSLERSLPNEPTALNETRSSVVKKDTTSDTAGDMGNNTNNNTNSESGLDASSIQILVLVYIGVTCLLFLLLYRCASKLR